jgi:hypothetical protein
MENYIECDELVCICGEAAEGCAHEKCDISKNEEHHFTTIYPFTVVRASTLYCKLCGKEWKYGSKCELTKDGRHQYELVEIKFQRLPIQNQSILK